MPEYGHSAPDSQQINFLKYFVFIVKNIEFRFERALNHYQVIILCHNMTDLVILGQYAQIWSFGPRPLKN